ncbi:unnamed protein product [Phaeothamnion confervicola]
MALSPCSALAGRPSQQPRECSYQEWSVLEQCNLVLFCVEPDDTAAAAAAFAKLVTPGNDAAVISLQPGVKNSAAFKDALRDKKVVLLDGAVGISVARRPADGSYRCLNRRGGCLVVQRVSKEDSERAVKFLNLLSTVDIPLLYRRTVTPYTWGAALYATGDAAAALSGLPLRNYLRSWHGRLVWAAMMREGVAATGRAAERAGAHVEGDNAWAPQNPCGKQSFAQLEALLCLPTPLFALAAWWLLPAPPGMAPAMQADLREGRETAARWTLDEIVQAGRTYSVPTPACDAVRAALRAAVEKKEGVPSIRPEALYAACLGGDSRGGGTPAACLAAARRVYAKQIAAFLLMLALGWLLAR